MAITPQPTVIVGNTQMNVNAAAGGTASRATTMMQKSTFWINVGLVLAVTGIGVILAQADLSFAWKIIIAIIMIVGGRMLAKAKFPTPLATWAGIIRGAGWIVLVTVLLLSGFGKMAIGGIEFIEKEASATTIACPKAITISVENRPNFTLKEGCEQIVNWTSPGEAQFQLTDSYFDGPINRYIKIVGTREVLYLTPRKGVLPAGSSGVSVAILTEEEAKPIQDGAIAPKAAALFGEFKP